MNKILAILLTLTAAVAAQAQFYAGAGVGYLIDSEEEYFNARLGYTVAERASISHAVELDVGLLTESVLGADIDVVPVLVNYRGTAAINEKLNVYFGAGAGLSFVDVSVSGWGSDSDQGFTLQALTGLEFKASDSVSINAGLRYLWIDEVWDIDMGDDVGVELGVKFRF